MKLCNLDFAIARFAMQDLDVMKKLHYKDTNMRRLILLLFAIYFLLPPLQLQASTPSNQYITMNLPEAVIVEILKKALPLSLKGSSSRLEGTITILNITNFHLKNQQILCHLDLMGRNLQLVTKVANQDIRLNLGEARTDFDCDARIRYDRSQQTLYIKPITKGIQGSGALSKGDIGQALLLLLNGREFPIAMQNLKPIIARASNKIITINTNIVDVRAVEGALQLSLLPVISSSPAVSGAHQSTASQQ